MKHKSTHSHCAADTSGLHDTMMKTIAVVLILLSIDSAGQVRLVADLNQGKKSPTEMKSFTQNENDGGRSYFIGASSELWTSDGTTAGTKFLKAFLEIGEIEVIGDIGYFSARTAEHGMELWKSNGTAAGTVRVKDIVPGYGNSTPLFLTRVNEILYFSANDVVNGRELWRSDGTASGTHLVKDIYAGPTGSQAASLLAEGNRIFFVANTQGPGYELWVSDGTSAGTQLVKDVNPGEGGSEIKNVTAANGKVYFSAQSPMRGHQLWKSDGTESGTSIVKVVNTSGSAQVSNIINVNGLIFFTATDGVHGIELFRSDGTEAGTFMLKDINRLLSGFSNIDGKLFFISYENEWSITDRNIWMSDGTQGGTIQLSSPGLYVNVWQEFHEINGAAYIFGLDRSADQSGLYRFDQSGTFSFVEQINWTAEDDTEFLQIGDLHFFQYDGYYWRSDGTSTGTYPLRLLCCGEGSQPMYLEDVGGILHFSTANPDGFWRTEGTAETTELIEEDFVEEIEGLNGDVFYRLGDPFGPGSTVWKQDKESGTKTEISEVATDPRYLTAAADRIYFVANTPSGERKIWVSDGTLQGTHAIEATPEPYYMAAFGSKIVFHIEGELWISDGTDTGTMKLTNVSGVQYKTEFNNELYFYALDEIHGLELWRTDGTPSGTAIVKDVRENDSNPPDQDLSGYAVFNDWLYFGGTTNDGDAGIWRTNGTTTGTSQVYAFDAGTIAALVTAGSNLFVILSVSDGSEIWTLNGTGATKLKDIDQQYSLPPAVKGNVMYIVTRFSPFNPEREASVWRSDGTMSGTYQIPFQGRPERLETSGDYVYLAGRADKEGSELFVIEESAGVSSASEVVVAEVVNSESEDRVLHYPSPFTEGFALHVSGEESSSFEMKVFSLDGRTVAEQELAFNTQHRIDADGWTNGMYVMKIRTSKGDIVRKIVKYSP